MTSAHTYTYEIDLATMLGGVTRTQGPQKTAQEFLSNDPLADAFPWNSPYSFAEGSPIANTDLDGLERNYEVVDVDMSKGTAETVLIHSEDIYGMHDIESGLDNYQIQIPVVNPFIETVNLGYLSDFQQKQKLLQKAEYEQQVRNYQGQRQLAAARANHLNPFWNLYQLSPIKDGLEIYSAYQESGTALAAVYLFVSVAPEVIERFGKSGLTRLRFTSTEPGMQSSTVDLSSRLSRANSQAEFDAIINEGGPIKILTDPNGENFVIDGHHRLTAASNANTQFKVKNIESVELKDTNFDSFDEVYEAAENTDFIDVQP